MFFLFLFIQHIVKLTILDIVNLTIACIIVFNLVNKLQGDKHL